MTPERFIEHTAKRCKQHGVKVRMPNSNTVKYCDDKECAGYFSSEDKMLVVASGVSTSEFYGLLAHESSHLDQWIENRYLWDKCSYGYSLFFEWLDGKIVKREQLEEAVQDIIRLELDCEIRTLKKIDKYKLPVNRTTYIQKVNTYLYGYLFFLEIRKWIPKIYSKKSLYGKAATRLKKEYSKIPNRLYAAFKAHT